MLNLDNIVSNKKKSSLEDNDWPFRMLIIRPSGSGKTNTLLHLINNLHPIDKIYLYAKDIHEPKYEYLINKREQAEIKNLNDPHAFIEYSDDTNDLLDDINDYNKNSDKKVLIVFDDIIADIECNKNFKRIIKELFYRARKINVSIVFITQFYFRALKDARLNSTHYIIMKINNKKELKRIAEEKSGHLDYKDFLKMYNYCTRDPYSFMMVDTRPTACVTFKKKIMTRKGQNKILDAKIESNANQYKVDRLNAEISAFSSGDLNKYEFLKRIDLNYKPNVLDKARFEFSPLGKTFNTGLDKTAQGYQEEGITKLLKDIRDSLAGNIIIPARPPRPDNNGNDDNGNDNNGNDDNGNDDNGNDNNGNDNNGNDDNGNDNDGNDLSWMNDLQLYKKIAIEVFSR